ncbi:methyl-accepting chemotaxis protein [Paenibacillus sp. PL2-23]|uniref:methyl-accepting chemotaxis protein n=1 Tax=Paenibacillus sp. PL2-23 TaxID=2100729 RepID=UPI0030FA050E
MKLSLRVKLVLIAALPLLFYAGTGVYLTNEQKSVYDDVKTKVIDQMVQVETIILNADRDMYQAYVAYLLLESGLLDTEGRQAALKDLSENYQQAFDRVAEAKSISVTADMLSSRHAESGESADELFSLFESEFTSWFQEASALAENNESQPVDRRLDNVFQTSRAAIDKIEGIAVDHSHATLKAIEERLQRAQTQTFVGIGLVSIALILFVVIMIIRMMRTIRTVVHKMQLVGEGNLTASREGKYDKDELGLIARSTDDMIQSMSSLVAGIVGSTKLVSESSSQLAQAAGESASASEHVANHIQEVASGSESQARSSEETSRAIEEMAVGISRIAENTSELADYSHTTLAQADQGHASLQRLLSQMEEIKSIIGKLSSTIGMLENRSQQIGSIADNITAFANQTNILSLNASIEAARAGEHGRGFAVVAGEIRKLAAGSLESAESINDLVTLTQNEIAGASSFMNKTLLEVERGNDRVDELYEKLNAITSAVQAMTEQLQENSAISEQMSASSEEVSASVEQSASTAAANLGKTESVAAATEEQLALMENILASAHELDDIVKQLSGAVAHFKVNT